MSPWIPAAFRADNFSVSQYTARRLASDGRGEGQLMSAAARIPRTADQPVTEVSIFDLPHGQIALYSA